MVRSENEKFGTNGVIVTIYEESSTVRLPRSKNVEIRATNPSQKRPSGYDRRAELLAHVHQLRNGGTQQVHQEPGLTKPTPIPKKRRRFLGPLRRFRCSFGRIFGESKKRWPYESIETNGCDRKYKLCRPRKSSWIKMSKKFCRVLRQFCIWKCNKFSRNEQELQDLSARHS